MAGKGDRRRPGNDRRYRDGWDRAFGKYQRNKKKDKGDRDELGKR